MIALPHCSEPRAKDIARALRDSVHASEPTLAGISFPAGTLSVSVGVASRRLFRGMRRAPDGGVEGGEALFRAADTALYEAKHGGRNYVSVA